MNRIPLVLASFLAANAALAFSSGPMASPWMAYPMSCVGNSMMPGGMMMGSSSMGYTWTFRANLPTVNSAFSGPVGQEAVTLSFWRVPCSDGKSVLMGRVVRDRNGLPEPVFTNMYAAQVSSHPHQLLRIARDPNTMWSDVTGAPFMAGFDFIVENGSDYQIDYSQPLELSMDGMPGGSVMIPAYASSAYPDAQLPLPMSGYMTGNWYDPAHSGEGVQVEIGEMSQTGRYITFAWYTFDSNGRPFWMFGQGAFDAGDRSANVSMSYAMGGGFAGQFGTGATPASWGMVTVMFTDCRTMQFDFHANSGLPADVPQGSGSRTWTRLTTINGLGCD